jgi:uncharacterized membrane protein YhaH (DUF805 family)
LWPVIAMECADAMDAVALSPLFRIFGAVAAHGILDVHPVRHSGERGDHGGLRAHGYTSMGWYVGVNTQLNVVGDIVSGLFALFNLIPSLAVLVRRLHDVDRSGWWLLLVFLPILGWFALFIFTCLDGTRGPNRFGLDPKNPNDVDVFL